MVGWDTVYLPFSTRSYDLLNIVVFVRYGALFTLLIGLLKIRIRVRVKT